MRAYHRHVCSEGLIDGPINISTYKMLAFELFILNSAS